MSADPQLVRARVAPELAEELPQLALWTAVVEASPAGRSPLGVRRRLRELSDRYTGAKAVQVRQQPIPWAYRVLLRQLGVDPDEHRSPPEALALERMRHGGFESRGVLDDALTIATVETGVALLALDADRVEGELELRLARPGERLGEDGRELSTRQVVVADDRRALAILFAEVAEDRGVRPSTRRVALSAIGAPAVPRVALEEAIWIAAEILSGRA